LLARQFGGTRFTAAGSCKKRRYHAPLVPPGFLDASQFDQHRFAFRQKLESRFVVGGGEVEFVALLGELGEFVICAEVGRGGCENLLPASDAGSERHVDVLKCLSSRGPGGRIGGILDMKEDVAGFGFTGGRVVASFVTEKGVFQSKVKVGGFEPHRFAELLAGGFGVSGFQEGVGEVLPDIGAAGRERGRFFKERDRIVVLLRTQGGESLCKCVIRRVFFRSGRFLSPRDGGDQEK
jgi:hypothetical protein